MRICAVVLMASIAVISIFFAYPALVKKEEAKAEGVSRIVRIWNIDTFEGGKGSRTSFLNSVARRLEKKNKEILFIVTSHTLTSAQTAVNEGEMPDMISFGSGGALMPELYLPLEKFSIAAASQNGKTVAVPWCRGGYMLFSLEGDFSDVSAKNTVISEGNFSLAQLAAVSENLSGGVVETSISAYVHFINGKYKYMLGTQRDVARLNTRGVQFTVKPLYEFSDLYQYIAVLSSETAKYNDCLDYISLLMSYNVQKQLCNIGLMSVSHCIYDESNSALCMYEKQAAKIGINAFCGEVQYVEMRELAAKALCGNGEAVKKLKNYLV